MTTRTHDATKEAALLAAAEAVSAGGSNPTDDNGDCLLPRKPMPTDYPEGGEIDIDTFEEVYRGVMAGAHDAVESGRDPRRQVAAWALSEAADLYDPSAMLRAARILMRWTQADLAEMVGAEQPSVARWERGDRVPGDGVRDALAEASRGLQPQDLDDLLVGLQRGVWPDDDWHDLPTFGGTDPADTSYPIWSWDAERLLVGESAEALEIIGRGELEEVRG